MRRRSFIAGLSYPPGQIMVIVRRFIWFCAAQFLRRGATQRSSTRCADTWETILRVDRNLVVLTLALFAASVPVAVAQVTNPTSPPFGTSSAGGSGGTPTGPTNPGAAGFGTNNVVTPNWSLNSHTGTAAGAGGIAAPLSGSRIMADPAWSSSVHPAPSTKRVAKRSARKRYAVHRATR